MAVVANINADSRKFRIENNVSGVARREIELLPESWSNLRNVVLAVFPEIFAIRVDYCSGVEEKAGHLAFVNRNNDHHPVFLGQLFHALGGRTVGNRLGELVPSDLLLSAKVGAVEKLLEAKNLSLLLGGSFDQFLRLFQHLLADVLDGVFLGRPLAVSLNESTAHQPSHQTPPTKLLWKTKIKFEEQVYPVVCKAASNSAAILSSWGEAGLEVLTAKKQRVGCCFPYNPAGGTSGANSAKHIARIGTYLSRLHHVEPGHRLQYVPRLFPSFAVSSRRPQYHRLLSQRRSRNSPETYNNPAARQRSDGRSVFRSQGATPAEVDNAWASWRVACRLSGDGRFYRGIPPY